MLKQVSHVNLWVHDQDEALAFFTEKLGFAVATDQQFDGTQRWIELRIPGADTRLVLFTPKGHEDRIGTFTSISVVCDEWRRPTPSSPRRASSSRPLPRSRSGARSRCSTTPTATRS